MEVGTWSPCFVPRKDLDTMEESSEIKVDVHPPRTSWLQSTMAASSKGLSKALGYITGEMKECGEGLKGESMVAGWCHLEIRLSQSHQ